MSYILDALKKADAERERGGVPGLHSQPQAPDPGDDDDEDARRGQTLPIVWIGAGAALCLIAVLSWQLMKKGNSEPDPQIAGVAPEQMAGGQAPVPPPPSMTPAQQQPPPMPATASPRTQEAPPTQGMATPPGTAVGTPPNLRPADVPTAPGNMGNAGNPANGTGNGTSTGPGANASANPHPPAPTATTANTSAASVTPSTSATQNGSRSTAAAPSNNQANPANQTGQRIPAFNELPDDVRRDIPQLTIGGAMYSETPSQRMLIVNSQVFHEGDQPYQGLVLEEIRLKSAVFKYRGHRYSINY